MDRMTLLERAWAWWRKVAPVPKYRTAVVPRQPGAPHVAAQYLALYTYLERRYASNVVLTFEQMEALLGFALPAVARPGRDWGADPPAALWRPPEPGSVRPRTGAAAPRAPAAPLRRFPRAR